MGNKQPQCFFQSAGELYRLTIATGRKILMPTFADRGVSRGQRGGILAVVNLSFVDRSRYFLFQVAPHLSSRGWVGPVQNPLLLRKSGSAGNRTRDLWVCSQQLWLLDHRGGQIGNDLERLGNCVFGNFPEFLWKGFICIYLFSMLNRFFVTASWRAPGFRRRSYGRQHRWVRNYAASL
jgi:hypothetical protein